MRVNFLSSAVTSLVTSCCAIVLILLGGGLNAQSLDLRISPKDFGGMLYWTAPPTVSYCDINVYGYVQWVAHDNTLLRVCWTKRI